MKVKFGYHTAKETVSKSREAMSSALGLHKDDDNTVASEEHVEIPSSSIVSAAALQETESTRFKLQHQIRELASIVRHDNEFREVTLEQIARVKIMHDRFQEGCEFSFNYNTLLLVASVLAALGLASNGTATIIASMLVSPIMGPVVGMAYGTTIHDWRMFRTAFRNECLSLIFCVVAGLTIGAICGPTDLSDNWPTDEMLTRGALENLLVGLPIAFFSGLGVAVSLLDDQANSLVGVAISASLLPPAVNAGMMVMAYVFQEKGTIADPAGEEDGSGNGDLYDRRDYRQYAVTSFLLTVSNIFIVYFASMLMFRMKEVLPIKKKVFWEDLGVARKIYTNKAFFNYDDHDHRTAEPTVEHHHDHDEEKGGGGGLEYPKDLPQVFYPDQLPLGPDDEKDSVEVSLDP